MRSFDGQKAFHRFSVQGESIRRNLRPQAAAGGYVQTRAVLTAEQSKGDVCIQETPGGVNDCLERLLQFQASGQLLKQIVESSQTGREGALALGLGGLAAQLLQEQATQEGNQEEENYLSSENECRVRCSDASWVEKARPYVDEAKDYGHEGDGHH